MTRFVQPGNQAAFEQEHVDFAIAATLNFTSGIVRAHMGVGTLLFGGNTFTGIGAAANPSGGFGSVSAMIEKPDARNTSQLYLSISGVDPTILGKVPQRSEFYGQFASVFFIPINSQSNSALSPGEPAIFEGFMDQLVYTRKHGVAQIQLTVKHYDSLFQQSIGLLYTDESQKSLFPTDNFFSQIATLPNKQVIWGGSAIDGYGGGAAGGGHGGPGSGNGPTRPF